MIAVSDWTRETVLGGRAGVSFALLRADGSGKPAARPVVSLWLDAIGDGQPGVTVTGEDLRPVTGLAMPMTRAGTFSLHVGATDDQGCHAETGLQRLVVVSQ